MNKSYRLTNYGEQFDFTVIEILSGDDFKLKDLYSLDEYFVSDLVSQGKGKDFSIWEI